MEFDFGIVLRIWDLSVMTDPYISRSLLEIQFVVVTRIL